MRLKLANATQDIPICEYCFRMTLKKNKAELFTFHVLATKLLMINITNIHPNNIKRPPTHLVTADACLAYRAARFRPSRSFGKSIG
jgi:hypothetical protein